MTTTTRLRGTSHCVDCRRPMRTSRRTIAECPGTVIYGGIGRCLTCYNRRKRGLEPYIEHSDQGPQFTNPRDRYNLTVFESFIRGRRRRGIPEEGVLAS